MSSFKFIAAAALLALTAGLTAGLAACGFQPVYADKNYRLSAPPSGSADVTADLARVRLAPVRESFTNDTQTQPGRGGQKLQNLLIDRMYPHGYPQQPGYTLEIALTSTETELGIQKDSSATRAELQMTAELVLKRSITAEPAAALVKTSNGDELYRTKIRTRVAYSILDAQYGTLVARENAVDRGLEQVANEIVNRLSLYFSRDPAAIRPASAPDSPDSPAVRAGEPGSR